MQLNENHVVLPREDFNELSATAHNNTMTPADRAASTIQTFIVFGGLVAGVAGSAFGVAKATDWLEKRRHARTMIELEKRYGSAPKQS